MLHHVTRHTAILHVEPALIGEDITTFVSHSILLPSLLADEYTVYSVYYHLTSIYNKEQHEPIIIARECETRARWVYYHYYYVHRMLVFRGRRSTRYALTVP